MFCKIEIEDAIYRINEMHSIAITSLRLIILAFRVKSTKILMFLLHSQIGINSIIAEKFQCQRGSKNNSKNYIFTSPTFF